MIFRKKPPKIIFHTAEDYIAELYPIQPASSYFSSNRKRLAKAATTQAKNNSPFGVGSSTHLCSGLRGLLDSCWVISAPIDIALDTDGDGQTINWEVPMVLDPQSPTVQFFEANMWADVVSKFKLGTSKTLLKIHTGWSVDLPKNHSLMFLPLDIFGEENRFTPFSGPLQAGRAPTMINPILYWHVLHGSEIIKAGTPLCLLKLVKDDLCDVKKDFDILVNDAEHKRRLSAANRGFSSVFGTTRHILYDSLVAGKR